MSARNKANQELSAIQEALETAQAQIVTAQEATAAAEAARDLLQQQLDEATAAIAQAPLGDHLNVPQIPRPAGSSWPIQESMQVTPAEYAEIQVRTANTIPLSMISCSLPNCSARSGALLSVPHWTGPTISGVKIRIS